MNIQKILITGATGSMGMECLRQLSADSGRLQLIISARDSAKNRTALEPYGHHSKIVVKWGDLTDYSYVRECVKEADVILHMAALVSPAADYYPKKAMQVNYGSTLNLLRAVRELGREKEIRFVYIGTVAETGERLPPIHWGRVGDPVKPSMFDYYAVSKVAAERLVIESGLTYWVSLRQTGIIGPAMSRIWDAIMLHNCFDNVLEYVSDRDSGRLLRNLCILEARGELDCGFWGHIYNIGGGKSCRIDTYHLYKNAYALMGIPDIDRVLTPKWQATRNFHGQYYLDSDRLEDYLHFRQDGIQYFYDCCLKEFGTTAALSRRLGCLPGGQRLISSVLRGRFKKLALSQHGTLFYLKNHMEDYIEAFWGGQKAWEALPESLDDLRHVTEWENVVILDHGYDESKPEKALHLNDIRQAAEFRGGKCLSEEMETGNWTRKLMFSCAFGHTFEASPRLILEGGHWCPVCERTSWNYGARAKRDPFFAQVWTPLHGADELREYPKLVSEADLT